MRRPWGVGPPAGVAGGDREFFGLTLAIALATLAYSAPPLRTKRRAWAAQATIAVARGLLLTAAGWSCVASTRGGEPWCLGAVLGLFLLGASATKDFSDVPGDAATGCATLPVVYGPVGAARRVAPFFIGPWLLLPAGAWAPRFDGRPILGGDPVVLTLLGFGLAAAGSRTAAALRADPAGLVAGGENHPAWRQMYRMTVAAYLGIAVAYLI